MKTPGEKSFLIKLYMVIFLSFCVLAGLVYLFILHLPDMNKSDTAAAKEPAVTASAETTRTPEVSSTPSASPSVSPSSVPSASPAVTSEPVPSSPSSLNTNQAKYDISTDSSLYRIVDKKHTIDASYVPDDLVVVNVNMYQQQRLRKDAASALETMFKAASDDGIELYLISGYRSYYTQTSLYHTYLQEYGQNYVDQVDCIPGTSEHQLGLLADLGSADQACMLESCFSSSSAYTWLQKHAWEYGYIERHPQNSYAASGVMYSPWDFRYVGKDLAKELYDRHKTMEEYFSVN